MTARSIGLILVASSIIMFDTNTADYKQQVTHSYRQAPVALYAKGSPGITLTTLGELVKYAGVPAQWAENVWMTSYHKLTAGKALTIRVDSPEILKKLIHKAL